MGGILNTKSHSIGLHQDLNTKQHTEKTLSSQASQSALDTVVSSYPDPTAQLEKMLQSQSPQPHYGQGLLILPSDRSGAKPVYAAETQEVVSDEQLQERRIDYLIKKDHVQWYAFKESIARSEARQAAIVEGALLGSFRKSKYDENYAMIGEVAVSMTGLDLPADVRDLTAAVIDVRNVNSLKTGALATVAIGAGLLSLIPVIGGYLGRGAKNSAESFLGGIENAPTPGRVHPLEEPADQGRKASKLDQSIVDEKAQESAREAIHLHKKLEVQGLDAAGFEREYKRLDQELEARFKAGFITKTTLEDARSSLRSRYYDKVEEASQNRSRMGRSELDLEPVYLARQGNSQVIDPRFLPLEARFIPGKDGRGAIGLITSYGHGRVAFQTSNSDIKAVIILEGKASTLVSSDTPVMITPGSSIQFFENGKQIDQLQVGGSPSPKSVYGNDIEIFDAHGSITLAPLQDGMINASSYRKPRPHSPLRIGASSFDYFGSIKTERGVAWYVPNPHHKDQVYTYNPRTGHIEEIDPQGKALEQLGPEDQIWVFRDGSNEPVKISFKEPE